MSKGTIYIDVGFAKQKQNNFGKSQLMPQIQLDSLVYAGR